LKAAISAAPSNINLELNYANLLWRTNREQDALSTPTSIRSNLNPPIMRCRRRWAISHPATERSSSAEKYFLKLEELYGRLRSILRSADLYTSQRQFDRAQASYRKANELAPKNALIVASAINSSLEGPDHMLPAAQQWVTLAAANPGINDNPQVMRERERYLTFNHQFQEAADLGYKVIEKLPRDPEAPVYLAYDLLFLNRYDDAFKIAKQFEPVLPNSRDLPLIEGYVYAHTGHPREAEEAYTRSIKIDANDATAFMNRGFARNDLREASSASRILRPLSNFVRIRKRISTCFRRSATALGKTRFARGRSCLQAHSRRRADPLPVP
jgi:tetratricopeptide (TPR) repeat protein